MKRLKLAALAFLLAATPLVAAPEENLRIIDEDTSFTVKRATGDVTITRKMTACAKNKGWLQPLVPEPGINPVTEIEVLKALNDDAFIVADMRELEWHLKSTIPGAVHVPYTEIATACRNSVAKKPTTNGIARRLKKVLGFCNGPVCSQSPSGMRAMIREGFPAEKIYYYRGGMLDWEALGLTTVEGSL